MLGFHALAAAPLASLAIVQYSIPTQRISVAVQEYASYPEVGLQLTETAADVTTGNRFAGQSGQSLLFAQNTNGSPRAVQFTYTRRGETLMQTAINVPAGKTWVFGPFVRELFDHPLADAAGGDLYVNAAHAGVLLSAVKLPGLSPPSGVR